MKKFTLLFLCSFAIIAANAQLIPNHKMIRMQHTGKALPTDYSKNTLATVPYLETFDAGMPADYVIQDLDGNTIYTPYQGFLTGAWTAVQLTGMTTPAAVSTSWYNTAGTSNDWMITTGIQIPATGTFEIKWKGEASDVSPWNDSYEVYVTSSIAGATPVNTDFTAAPIFTTPGENDTWTNHSYTLPGTFNGQTIYIAFRNNMTDGNLLFIDDIEVKAFSAITNDVEVTKTFADFSGFSYYEVMPLSQVTDVYLAAKTVNNGSAAQTNVTLAANDAANSVSASSIGMTLAPGVTDTLVATATLDNTNAKDYTFTMNVTQTETDEVPANNAGDDVMFSTDPSWYFRTFNLNAMLTSYSFSTPIVASSGMEYGANYHFLNPDVVDSISVVIYGASGTGTITGKLYNIDLTTGAYTEVATTNPYTPSGTTELKTLALTTPFSVPAGSFLAATVKLNLNVTTAPRDTIKIGAESGFPGVSGIAGSAYLNNAGTWDWYSVTGTVPMVGLIIDNATNVSQVNLSKDIMVYPNPASNYLYVLNQKAVAVEIVNLNGEVVAKYNDQNVINVANLAQGAYFVKVITDTKTITEKINIIH